MCFGCSKEPSHRDGSFEYPQHMFWLRNKKINFSYALLSGGLGGISTLISWTGLNDFLPTQETYLYVLIRSARQEPYVVE